MPTIKNDKFVDEGVEIVVFDRPGNLPHEAENDEIKQYVSAELV